eukprot:c13663_g1_i1 orf=84-437(-)
MNSIHLIPNYRLPPKKIADSNKGRSAFFDKRRTKISQATGHGRPNKSTRESEQTISMKCPSKLLPQPQTIHILRNAEPSHKDGSEPSKISYKQDAKVNAFMNFGVTANLSKQLNHAR